MTAVAVHNFEIAAGDAIELKEQHPLVPSLCLNLLRNLAPFSAVSQAAASRHQQRKREAADDEMDWDEDIVGKVEGGFENDRFSIIRT